MKLIVLNIWGGKIFEPLMEFLDKKSIETDVFCFQEVFHTASGRKNGNGSRVNIFSEISALLGDFKGYFVSVKDGSDFGGLVDYPLQFGLAIFIRNSIPIDSFGDFSVYTSIHAGYGHSRSVQYLRFKNSGKNLTLCNFHGLVMHENDSKEDSAERIEQSRKIKEFLDKEQGGKILCGDFNLHPNTKSLNMLEENMTNLIKTHRITTTRSPLYTRSQKFADYILVSPKIEVKDFKVLQDLVSDHLPLYLEFS